MPQEGDDTNDLKTKVEGWLHNQGYSLEMNVAKLFVEAGFGIRQGATFMDPEENKPREIDVLAFSYPDSKQSFAFQLIIECKYSKKPYIVFTYPDRKIFHPNLDFILCTNFGKSHLKQLYTNRRIFDMPILSPKNGPLGYTIKQANIKISSGSNDKDSAYDAIMKISKASFSILDYHKKQGESGFIGLPLIVLDGPLFECYLDAENEVKVEPISNALINWSYPPLGNFYIFIYTMEALPKFVDRAWTLSSKLFTE